MKSLVPQPFGSTNFQRRCAEALHYIQRGINVYINVTTDIKAAVALLLQTKLISNPVGQKYLTLERESGF